MLFPLSNVFEFESAGRSTPVDTQDRLTEPLKRGTF